MASATIPIGQDRTKRAPASAIARLGELVIALFEWFGQVAIFSARATRAAFTPPWEFREFLRQCDFAGARSFPLVALAGAATGVVMSLQLQASLTQFGARSLLPAVIVFSICKETGPVITGLIVSGRVGAGIGAELGAMKVTEQIDAMEASAVDPMKYLAATRIAACICMLPLLTIISDLFGVLLGWAATNLTQPMSLRLFMENGFKDVTFSDVLPPTLRTAVYGGIIGVVGCYQGMNVRGGTEGVGRASTSAVVLSSLFIILADILLVRLIIVFFPS